MKNWRFVIAAIALLALSTMISGCVPGGLNISLLPPPRPRPVVYEPPPPPPEPVAYEQAPAPQQELVVAPVEIGVPVYGLPLPEGVVIYRGHYDYYTFENVDGIMVLTYWNNGGIRVYADERWDHGRRMEYSHWGEYRNNYRVPRAALEHHRAEMNRHRTEVRQHAEHVAKQQREINKREAKTAQPGQQKAAPQNRATQNTQRPGTPGQQPSQHQVAKPPQQGAQRPQAQRAPAAPQQQKQAPAKPAAKKNEKK